MMVLVLMIDYCSISLKHPFRLWNFAENARADVCKSMVITNIERTPGFDLLIHYISTLS